MGVVDLYHLSHTTARGVQLAVELLTTIFCEDKYFFVGYTFQQNTLYGKCLQLDFESKFIV